jgi:hypothetical protein
MTAGQVDGVQQGLEAGISLLLSATCRWARTWPVWSMAASSVTCVVVAVREPRRALYCGERSVADQDTCRGSGRRRRYPGGYRYITFAVLAHIFLAAIIGHRNDGKGVAETIPVLLSPLCGGRPEILAVHPYSHTRVKPITR